jgi:glycosyltransferase involved in cell wall biosynthesis
MNRPVRRTALRVARVTADRAALSVATVGANRPVGLAADRVRRARLTTLLATLQPQATPPTGADALLAAVVPLIVDVASCWLAIAVLSARLPDEAEVLRVDRMRVLDGAAAALQPYLQLRGRVHPRVRVVSDTVLVDMHHTAQTDLATGIQRVARRSAEVWNTEYRPMLVGWTAGYTALRALSDAERARALHGGPPLSVPAPEDEVLVPWHCRYVLPELLTELDRAERLGALLRFSGTRGSFIGFDCCPISVAETSVVGMSAGFAAMLGAAAWAQRLTAISDAAAAEYSGWRSMLAGTGLQGPVIRAISLATEAPPGNVDPETVLRALDLTGDRPYVLVVGSHEPRKNHLAVLYAAEVLWAEGLQFELAFVGGAGWKGEQFQAMVDEASRNDRPVVTRRGLPDDVLAAAYAGARFTVFPSWNEGFGLPVAESLAAGTPVITSRFGSMAEIAAAGGALLVDPRRDDEIIAAMRQLLTDDATLARLQTEAKDFPVRTWRTYATETWEFLVTSVAG